MKEEDGYSGEDYDGCTPLHIATRYNQMEIVRFLLAQEVDVNSVDRFGRSALYDAVLNRNKPITFELRNAGANIIANHEEITTKILRAAKIGDLEFIKLLYFAGLKNLHDYFNTDLRNIAHIVYFYIDYIIIGSL